VDSIVNIDIVRSGGSVWLWL